MKELLLFKDMRGEDIVTDADIERIQSVEEATGQLILSLATNEDLPQQGTLSLFG